MTDGFTLREVGKLLGLSRSIVCGLIDAGYVAPARGRRGEYRFAFNDLVLLRAAQGLVDARISSTRILRSLRRLKAQLPDKVPLWGLRIEAVGDAVVVSEGPAQWQPDDGQYILRFHVESPEGRIAFFDPPTPRPAASDDTWFEKGLALETSCVEEASRAYRRALAANATHLGAYTNLGHLLHAQGRLNEAEAVYRAGLSHCGRDATLLFNLGILMEDLQQTSEAEELYRAALQEVPEMADAHYNLALLYEAKGLRQAALRHLSAFRRLTAGN